jgi:hypothetical protein
MPFVFFAPDISTVFNIMITFSIEQLITVTNNELVQPKSKQKKPAIKRAKVTQLWLFLFTVINKRYFMLNEIF